MLNVIKNMTAKYYLGYKIISKLSPGQDQFALGPGRRLTSNSPDVGIGYVRGAGDAVEQLTSRTTGIILNAVTGHITLFSAAGSATAASFTVTNSSVADSDIVVINQNSGTDLYHLLITDVADGSFQITFFTTGGTTTEQPVLNFAIIKGSDV